MTIENLLKSMQPFEAGHHARISEPPQQPRITMAIIIITIIIYCHHHHNVHILYLRISNNITLTHTTSHTHTHTNIHRRLLISAAGSSLVKIIQNGVEIKCEEFCVSALCSTKTEPSAGQKHISALPSPRPNSAPDKHPIRKTLFSLASCFTPPR